MKVTGGRPLEGQDVYLKTQKTKGKDAVAEGRSGDAKKTGAKDRVDLSGRAREVEDLKAEIQNIPDVRKDRVEAVRKSVESGNYRIDPGKIAGKLLEEL